MDNHKDTIEQSYKATSDAVNGFYNQVLKKFEKLNNALYVVTNFLSDSEPVKWHIRQLSLEATADLSAITHQHDLYKTSAGLRVVPTVKSIIRLLDTISATGVVSEMNLEILRQEYGRTLETIDREFPLAFKRQLEGALPAPVLAANTLNQPLSSSFSPVRHNLPATPSSKPDHEHTVSVPHVRSTFGNDGSDEAKTTRQAQIRAYLTGRSWTSIKDVAGQIKGCSRKTVQRDLAELVEQNILEKQGERRWSRYRVLNRA